MQTFLPYACFKQSAKALDYRRLGKQRSEAKQCLFANIFPEYRWRHHPCAKLWTGYEKALCEYGITICTEWISRGYLEQTSLIIFQVWYGTIEGSTTYPPWLGYEPFHKAHRSNLVQKKPRYYRPIFEPDLPDNLPYLWKSDLAHLY